MNRNLARCAASVALAGFVAAAVPATVLAKDAATCVSSDEADAFRMRDLQSRLMVAALSCNQLTAYNTFIERFRPTLASAGKQIAAYHQRTGGGEAALNRHMTQLANAAALSRAEAPEQYCGDTWAIFLLLEDEPSGLATIAAKDQPGVATPAQCGMQDAPVNAPVNAMAPAAPALPSAPMVKGSTTN